jgi:hypothetical protein
MSVGYWWKFSRTKPRLRRNTLAFTQLLFQPLDLLA